MFRRRPPLTLPLTRDPPFLRSRGERSGARGVCWGACFLLFCISVAASPGVRAADQPPAPQPAPVSVDELERLVHTLQDDTARAKLVQAACAR